jgi:DNA-binding IclR family transcriptional regulator
MPLHTSSSGKAYLGALSDEEFARFLESHGDEPEELLTEFAAIRTAAHGEILADGYTQVRGGNRFSETINAAAVPYRPSDLGEPVAFLASSTSQLLSDQRISDEVGPALADAVSEVRRMTGQQSALVMNE